MSFKEIGTSSEQKGGIMNTTPFPALSAETLLAVNTVGQWLAQNDFPANNLIRRIASSWRAMR